MNHHAGRTSPVELQVRRGVDFSISRLISDQINDACEPVSSKHVHIGQRGGASRRSQL